MMEYTCIVMANVMEFFVSDGKSHESWALLASWLWYTCITCHQWLNVSSYDKWLYYCMHVWHCTSFLLQKTGEIGELSCGWSSLPLFEHSGNPTPNKTFELKVHGGTPFESGVEVDPASQIKGVYAQITSLIPRPHYMYTTCFYLWSRFSTS